MGLVPFDPESVVSKLDIQLQTPTPVEEEASHPTPWVLKRRRRFLRPNLSLNIGGKIFKDNLNDL